MLQSTGVVAQAEYAASSQHSSAASLISRGLYDDLHSFAELEQRITNLGAENTKIVGDAFEIFVEALSCHTPEASGRYCVARRASAFGYS